MEILDAIKQMMDRSGTSGSSLSYSIGKDRNAVSTMFSRGTTPRVDTLVKMCDAMGYRLVLESDEDRIEVGTPTSD